MGIEEKVLLARYGLFKNRRDPFAVFFQDILVGFIIGKIFPLGNWLGMFSLLDY